MRLAKKFVGVLAIVAVLGICVEAKAFNKPTSVVPYMPINNLVLLTKTNPANAAVGVTYYIVSPGKWMLGVPTGTTLAAASKQAALQTALTKFLSFAKPNGTNDLVAAEIWFMKNIGPAYR